MMDRLALDPDLWMLGLEIRRKWASIVDERLRERHGARGRVFAEDAGQVLPRFPAASVRAVFIHFPDPWWKKRHFKRRVVTPELISHLARVLVPGGELFLQTDVEDRAEAFEALIRAEPRFVAKGKDASGNPSPRVAENPFGAMSPRERRATVDGLPITRLLYARTES